ncbi:MAG TPA: protein kinase [Thermoanaerobaculia bacterium]
MSTAAPFLSRQLGDYMLVAQLSEDALGTVFRALHAADERHFVRLRILRGTELPSDAIEAAIHENASWTGALAHPAIVDREVLDVVEDLPFLTWDETSGWTLDVMLARVRAFGIRIPAEYALLIAERIAAALEHVHRGGAVEGPNHHGLLWPGFVSISHDAAVRIGGFGLAEAILPSLEKPRLAAEVAPYIAPESRDEGLRDPRADVYALGMILAELLTGRRPVVGAPPPELRAGDPRSDELETFLRRCVAPRDERFASAVEAHREIQQMVTGNPFSLYTANLALFLYKLLNPESQLAMATSEEPVAWENTNPVVIDPSATLAARRRAAPETPAEPPHITPDDAWLPAPAAAPEPPRPVEAPSAEEALQVVALEANSILQESEDAEVEAAVASIQAVELVDEEDRSVVVYRFPDKPLDAPQEASPERDTADVEPVPARVVVPREVVESPVRLWATAWTRPASALAAAAGLTLGAFLLFSQFREGVALRPRPKAPAKASVGSVPSEPAPAPELSAAAAPAASSISTVSVAAPVAAVISGGSTGRVETASVKAPSSARGVRPAPAPSRQPAENLRLRAALARIEADRVNARQAAGDLFGEGRNNEEEGERLLRQREYPAAELAFSRAARLFQQAQEISWERRLRESDLSNSNTR